MNDYAVAFYGWIFFNAILLGMAKDHDDDAGKRFNFKVWWRTNWDNMVVTFLAIPIIVTETDSLWGLIINDWLERDYPYNSLALFGAVPLVQLIYYIIRKFAR